LRANGEAKQNISRFTLPRSAVGSDASQYFASPRRFAIQENKGKIREATIPSAAKRLITVHTIRCFFLLLELNILAVLYIFFEGILRKKKI